MADQEPERESRAWTDEQQVSEPPPRSPGDGGRRSLWQLWSRKWQDAARLLRGGLRGRRNSVRLVVLGIPLVLLVIAVVSAAGVYVRLDDNVRTFDRRGIDPVRPPTASPDAIGNVPVNVLLIGSDTRGGGNERLGGGAGAIGRSDTTILLHVYADHRSAVAVSIPRDALVDIPRCRLPDGSWSKPRAQTMFNTAFSVGGSRTGNPACTQNTVEKLTGLRVDHTIVVDFEGFAAMTEAVGGVDVCVPHNVYEGDLNPHHGSRGKLVFARGRQTVTGRKALDYVRLRHGMGDGSDIGRIERQQAFLASMVAKIRGQGLDPTTLLPLADAATRSLTVDPGLDSTNKLLSFALSLRKIRLDDITFVTVPWRYSGYRVVLVQPDTKNLWAALKADRSRQMSGETASPGTRARRRPDVVPTPTEGVSGHQLRKRIHADRELPCAAG
jgi:LCP family protein required for cell wall assembly